MNRERNIDNINNFMAFVYWTLIIQSTILLMILFLLLILIRG